MPVPEALQALTTIRDFVRWGGSEFNRHGLMFGHGFVDAIDEARYLTLHALRPPNLMYAPKLMGKLVTCRYWIKRIRETRKKLSPNFEMFLAVVLGFLDKNSLARSFVGWHALPKLLFVDFSSPLGGTCVN